MAIMMFVIKLLSVSRLFAAVDKHGLDLTNDCCIAIHALEAEMHLRIIECVLHAHVDVN